jgi:hypothetical protein
LQLNSMESIMHSMELILTDRHIRD